MHHIARKVLEKGLFGKASKVFVFKFSGVIDMKTVMEPLENSEGSLRSMCSKFDNLIRNFRYFQY